LQYERGDAGNHSGKAKKIFFQKTEDLRVSVFQQFWF
jgi:hypothetical protein